MIATTIVTNVIKKKHRAKHCTKFDKNSNKIKSIKINAIRKVNDNFFKANRQREIIKKNSSSKN